MDLIIGALVVLGGVIWAAFAGREKKPDEMEYLPSDPVIPPKTPVSDEVEPEPTPIAPPPTPAPVAPPVAASTPAVIPGWDTQKKAFKSVRMLCDEAGLSLAKTIPVHLNGKLIGHFAPKDIICACIMQESGFQNYYLSGPRKGAPVKFENKEGGKIWSTDWGIVQINDTKGWHIGPGLPFASVQSVLDNPAKAVQYMIKKYKEGRLSLWSSYKFNHYKEHLLPNSPMWKLRS